MTTAAAISQRAITHRTKGSTHGPITRLMSPGDLGELLKPFVFLDIFDMPRNNGKPVFGMHPHSGISTVTYMIKGDITYEDTTGAQGVLPAGGVEWMRAGNGVWHTAGPADTSAMLGFQLWLALPPELENGPAQSIYLAPDHVPDTGPARVLLGGYSGVASPITSLPGINYLAVSLKNGEQWRYTPPAGHTVAWVALNEGQLDTGDVIEAGELAIFEEGNTPIQFVARGSTSFVLGSAIKHPHELVTGNYSVHTSEAALMKGETEIRRIGLSLNDKRQVA